MLSVLADVSRDLAALATSLLRIFRQEKKELVLIKTVATKEMEQEGKTAPFWCSLLTHLSIAYVVSMM